MRRGPDSDNESREGFESPRTGLFSLIGPTAESTVPASSGAVRRLVLVGAESHGGHAALAATVEDPPNSPQPNEPVAPAHDLESPSESDTESLGRDGLSQVAPEVLQEPGDADIHDPEGIVQDHMIGEMRINPAFRRGLESMDHVDLRVIFSLRACVMKCVPAFMKGSYRNAMRLTLREADRARSEADVLGLSRAWKAFLLLPRMLLHRLPPRRFDRQVKSH